MKKRCAEVVLKENHYNRFKEFEAYLRHVQNINLSKYWTVKECQSAEEKVVANSHLNSQTSRMFLLAQASGKISTRTYRKPASSKKAITFDQNVEIIDNKGLSQKIKDYVDNFENNKPLVPLARSQHPKRFKQMNFNENNPRMIPRSEIMKEVRSPIRNMNSELLTKQASMLSTNSPEPRKTKTVKYPMWMKVVDNPFEDQQADDDKKGEDLPVWMIDLISIVPNKTNESEGSRQKKKPIIRPKMNSKSNSNNNQKADPRAQSARVPEPKQRTNLEIKIKDNTSKANFVETEDPNSLTSTARRSPSPKVPLQRKLNISRGTSERGSPIRLMRDAPRDKPRENHRNNPRESSSTMRARAIIKSHGRAMSSTLKLDPTNAGISSRQNSTVQHLTSSRAEIRTEIPEEASSGGGGEKRPKTLSMSSKQIMRKKYPYHLIHSKLEERFRAPGLNDLNDDNEIRKPRPFFHAPLSNTQPLQTATSERKLKLRTEYSRLMLGLFAEPKIKT